MGNSALTSGCIPPPWSSGTSRTGTGTGSTRNGRTSARRKEKRTMKLPTLPVDMLLEIVARADAATIVRFAAASKYLRRHIADPAFLKHYDGDFVPNLLLGMFQQQGGHQPYRFVSMPPSTKLALPFTPLLAPPDAADFFGSCVPVTSRAGLVLLRGVDECNLMQLCVYNPVKGRHAFLPPASLYDHSHVLIPPEDEDEDDDGDISKGHSFRLLIVDKKCQTQIFSTRARWWGEITQTHEALPSYYHRVQPATVVLRGVAHWLYHDRSSDRYKVLGIRIDDGQVAATGLVPESCLQRRREHISDSVRHQYKDLILVSTDGRQLGLVVADVVGISVWTLSEDLRNWGARRVVVDRVTMLRSMKLHDSFLVSAVYLGLEWFGETSGALVVKVPGAGIIVLNLRTGKIDQFSMRRERDLVQLRYCPYEVDLTSLLASLRPF